MGYGTYKSPAHLFTALDPSGLFREVEKRVGCVGVVVFNDPCLRNLWLARDGASLEFFEAASALRLSDVPLESSSWLSSTRGERTSVCGGTLC